MRRQLHQRALALTLAFVSATLGLTGCSSDVSDPNDPPELEVVNQVPGLVITEVNYRPCGTTQWGSDQLSGSIANGQSRGFQVTPGCYDLRASDGAADEATLSNVTLVKDVTYRFEVVIP